MSNDALSVTSSSYAAIIQAVHDIAVTATFATALKGSTTGLLPTPAQLGAIGYPYLTVRVGEFLGYADLASLRTGRGDQFARLPSGTGRVMGWDFQIVVLYDLAMDGTQNQIAANAAADLVTLEALFQTKRTLNDVAQVIKQNPHSLNHGPLSKYGMTIAGKQLFFCALTARVYEQLGVTYQNAS